jgi:large subunit ribosomal protein L28
MTINIRISGDILKKCSDYDSMRGTMAKTCAITGKKSLVGGGYSNRTRATQFNPTGKRRRKVNMQKKTIFVPEINKKITIKVSAKGIKTINKNGAFKTLKVAKII